jgi:hypothetical protein
MKWAHRIGGLIAVLVMAVCWLWCDLFGHGDELREWVFLKDDERTRGFFMRCQRCYRFTRAD